MPSRVHQLSNLLQFWEDAMLLTRICQKCIAASGRKHIPINFGPLRHAGEFRAELKAAAPDTFDHERFLGNPVQQAYLSETAPGGWIIPHLLWQWVCHGSRAIVLDEKTRREFESSSFAGKTWDNIRWPACKCFLTILDNPIRTESGRYEILLIMLNDRSYPGNPGIIAMRIDKKLSSKLLTQKERTWCKKAADRRINVDEWKRVMKKTVDIFNRLTNKCVLMNENRNIWNAGELVTDCIGDFTDNRDTEEGTTGWYEDLTMHLAVHSCHRLAQRMEDADDPLAWRKLDEDERLPRNLFTNDACVARFIDPLAEQMAVPVRRDNAGGLWTIDRAMRS